MRDPAINGCLECDACFLWANAKDDDRLAIDEIKREANAARQKEGKLKFRHLNKKIVVSNFFLSPGFTVNCQIGATASPPPPARNVQLQDLNGAFYHGLIVRDVDLDRLNRVPRLRNPVQNPIRIPERARPQNPR